MEKMVKELDDGGGDEDWLITREKVKMRKIYQSHLFLLPNLPL